MLVFGGESSEHDVSIMSARNVYAAMDDGKYDVYLCYIDRKGKWWLLEDWLESLDDHGGQKVSLLPGSSSIIVLPDNKKLHVDVAFPVMHGENGHEDGVIQGAMQLAHIPVVGSNIQASAVCWDKLLAKQLLVAGGIAVTPFAVYRQGQDVPSYDQLAKDLGRVLFVKPVTAGSSIGVSKVEGPVEFEEAILTALDHSDTVLIETAIIGRELEVAVLGVVPNHRVSGIGEIIPGESFYTYDDKYAEDSTAQVLSNATVSEELRDTLQQTAHTAFALLGCKGLARVDFLVSEAGDVYVNELNTLPGFTNISQYPKLWQEAGISYSVLIDELIGATKVKTPT